MTCPAVPPLKRILEFGRHHWDRSETRPAVRQAFGKVLDCRTAVLGAEVFASANEERVVYHTCKSRACPSCGYRATTLWQRDQWRELPDIPYAHVSLTMPDVLWPIFRRNRHLLHDLPVLGAQVLQQWARRKYGVRLMIMVIPHTFGRHLNFNCHLHILVSEGGLKDDGTGWQKQAPLNRKALMPMWRYAVMTYLREAHRMGFLKTDRTSYLNSSDFACGSNTSVGGISTSNGSAASNSFLDTRAGMPGVPRSHSIGSSISIVTKSAS